MATEMGLSIYTETRNGGQWWYLHSGQGWPQDRLSSLAFLGDGRLVAGFARSGLLIGNLRQAISQWQRFSASEKAEEMDKFEGVGLAGSQINGLLVMRDGRLAVATSSGLAVCDAKGFRFWRGRNHARKLELLEENPRKVKDPGGLRLREDHCTCLGETGDGKLLVGHWEHGYDLVDLKADKVEASDKPKEADFIRGFVSPCAGPTWLITYRSGVQICQQTTLPGPQPEKSRIVIQYPKMPSYAPAPDRAWLLDFCQRLSQVRPAVFSKQVSVTALPDDWRTQGTVMGRRGDYLGVFCAMTSVDDLYTYPVNCNEPIAAWMGKNHPDPQDSVRRWRHWKHTDQERCLQNNHFGGRTESEWDDHKEAYPRELDGPHVMASWRMRHPGDYIVSAYFINPNGHDGTARWRDYELDLRHTPLSQKKISSLTWSGGDATPEFRAATISCRARVNFFWSGCWKRFLVHVPEGGDAGGFTLKVGANYSFNTIISGLMVDFLGPSCSVSGLPFDGRGDVADWGFFSTSYQKKVFFEKYQEAMVKLPQRPADAAVWQELSDIELAFQCARLLTEVKKSNPRDFNYVWLPEAQQFMRYLIAGRGAVLRPLLEDETRSRYVREVMADLEYWDLLETMHMTLGFDPRTRQLALDRGVKESGLMFWPRFTEEIKAKECGWKFFEEKLRSTCDVNVKQ